MIRKIISSVLTQFSTPLIFNTTLNDLPTNVIERIFSYLTYDEVVKARKISRYVYEIAAEYIKKGINKLRISLEESLTETYNFLLSEGVSIKDKISTLAQYNIYKILECEIDIICTLNRHILQNKDFCLPIGSLLDLFYTILKQTQRNKHNACEIYKVYSNDFYNEVKSFLHNMESNEHYIFDIIPLGVQTVDLMDLLLETDYKFSVTYRIKENLCQIRGIYTINKAKLLNYFPQLPKSCTDRQLTEEESKAIMKYLSILLQVHNRLNIEEDFGWLQIDTQTEPFSSEIKNTITKISQKYTVNRIYNNREIIDIKKGIIKENYVNENKDKEDTSSQGIIFKVNLTCTLENAPVQVKKAYQQLKEDIEKKHLTVRMISPKVFDYQLQPTNDKEWNVYGLLLYLKIWYSTRFKNVFPKDTVEFYFNDGNTTQTKW